MAMPTSPEMQKLLCNAFLLYQRDQERILRALLCRWVSELEPVVIYGGGSILQIKGLGIKDDPTGRVVIPNPGYWPDFFERFKG